MRNVVSRILRLSPGLACVLFATAGLVAQTPTQPSAQTPAIPADAPNVAPQQAPAAGQQSGTLTIPVSVNEVYLVFAVTDKKGHFIRDLKQSDFALLDD